jgi:hypothetical protein
MRSQSRNRNEKREPRRRNRKQNVAEKRVKIKLGSRDVEVTQVEIVRRDEKLFEYDLEDGATIRVINSAAIVYRMDDTDEQGNPYYIIKNGLSVVVVKGPTQ